MKKNIFIVFITIIIVCFISIKADAQENVNFQHITIEDGLSQSTAEVIFQDSQGYIWIGTNEGLNRYNGFEMKIYKADKTKKNTIVNNYILSIQEDHEKNLWVGTNRGISKIDLETDEIVNYEKDKSGRQYYNVRSILVTKKGSVIAVTSNNVYLYNRETGDLDEILNKRSIFNEEDIMVIKEDNFQNIWVGTNKSLIKLNKNTLEETKYISKDSIENDGINSILIDDENSIWVSTKNNGLKKIIINENGTNEVIDYYHDEDDEFSIPSNTTNSMIQDRNGTIWIGTEKGICKYLGDDKFYSYQNKSYDENSLINNSVYSLMEDSNGLIWVGTYTGISLFDPNNKIIHYKSDPLDENSLSGDVIHGIYEDVDGKLWVGTRNRGLNIIDRKNDKYKTIYGGDDDYQLTDNSIRVIEGHKDTVWVGTNYGLNQIDRNTMKIKKYTVDNGLTNNSIKSLLFSEGYLWIGTKNGLNILDITNDEIIDITDYLKRAGVTDNCIQEIYRDKDGLYWFGNFVVGSLIKINIDDRFIKVYKASDCETEQEIADVKCISEYNDILWIGTSEGLVKFNKTREVFTRYTDEDGLSNNTIYGLLIDNEGNPWVSTNNGISKFDLKTYKFNNLSSTDGLQSNEFNEKAHYKTKEGEFVFGGIKGLNIFKPEDILKSSYEPKVIFENFDVNGEKYKNIDGMKFEYNENFFRIKYFFPEYKANNNLKFYYKLEGLVEEWVQVNGNEIIFNKLSPGRYTFKIKARSQNGNMGKESTVSFTIRPPIWKSKEAIVVYIFIILLMTYIHTKKVKRLDYLVEIRTKALSKEMQTSNQLLNKIIEVERNKNNYFINLSHELRTPLNVISSVEQLITNLNKSDIGVPKDKLEEYMQVMNKNIRRLLNLINNIIDTTKIENGKYKINIKEENIVYVVEEAALGLKDAIESNGISLIIDTDTEEKIIKCDSYEIERCIVNLLSNASKFTKKGGTIKVDIKDLDDKVKITVEDTGIGIDEKYYKAIFDRFNQIVDENTEVKGGSGLGLTITKHIIDMHKGDIYVESKKNIGTKFTIILPVEGDIHQDILI